MVVNYVGGMSEKFRVWEAFRSRTSLPPILPNKMSYRNQRITYTASHMNVK